MIGGRAWAGGEPDAGSAERRHGVPTALGTEGAGHAGVRPGKAR